MYILIANFGNKSVALIQWFIENQKSPLSILSVDTGWSATHWSSRTEEVSHWLRSHNLKHERIKPIAPFEKWIRDRQEFPSAKFQWCAELLKGVPINEWLEKYDPHRTYTIAMSKRRIASRVNHGLTEWIYDSDHYGGRNIWHPLYNCPDEEYDALLSRSGIKRLSHRSLECDPCVHNRVNDFIRLDEVSLQRVKELETSLNKTMFCPEDYGNAQGIEFVKAACHAKSTLININESETFDMGCGSPWGCGE